MLPEPHALMRGRMPRARPSRDLDRLRGRDPTPPIHPVPRAPSSSLDDVSVDVEFLFWEGCPSHPRALADLRVAMADFGLDPHTVTVHAIDTHEQAERERFVGSPTIRVDGVDIQPPGEEPFGLACRVYHRRDGRVSPTPDPDDVREALRAAAARRTQQTEPNREETR